VGPDGWVPAEQLSDAKDRALKFKQDAFNAEDSSGSEDDALAEEHWIFDDFDESEYD
jgi:hypothetical protein